MGHPGRHGILVGATLLALVAGACTPGDRAADHPTGSPPPSTASAIIEATPTPAGQVQTGVPGATAAASASSAPAAPPATAPEGALAGSPSPAPSAILVGAGDIGACGTGGPAATAQVLQGVVSDHPDAIVFTTGDNAYPSGSASDFERCYDPWWGPYLDRTRPAAGNHDWLTRDAAGYRAYFGRRAGTGGGTWYAYDAGTWRVIVLDSDCGNVGGCGPSSPQGRWLAGELAAHPAGCTLAMWHHPRFSSGPHGNQRAAAPLFDALYAAGADVVVNGHDHDYERFAPQDPAGRSDPTRGIREFVVGTGGGPHYAVATVKRNSEVRENGTYGVLVLELGAGRYAWRFEPAGNGTFTDAGSGTCH